MSRQPRLRGCRFISWLFGLPSRPAMGRRAFCKRPFGIAGDWQGFPLRVLAPRSSTYRGACVRLWPSRDIRFRAAIRISVASA
jgi:hypothetical protein